MNLILSDDVNPENPFLREVFDGSPEMQAVILALLESRPEILDDILDLGNDIEKVIDRTKRLNRKLDALLEAQTN
jgi:hypothetical protein